MVFRGFAHSLTSPWVWIGFLENNCQKVPRNDVFDTTNDTTNDTTGLPLFRPMSKRPKRPSFKAGFLRK